MENNALSRELDRRSTLAWMGRAGLVIGAGPALLAACGAGQTGIADIEAPGYGRDPKLTEPQRPWPLTLTDPQKSGLAKLADLMLPADTHGPVPSSIGIADFFDEWMSAPYPDQRADRRVILSGLEKLDRDAGGSFAKLAKGRAEALLDRLASAVPPAPGPERKADFFITVRRTAILGYYTSEAGLADIGHVVPIARTSFTGPPAEVRAKLGI